MPVRLRSVKAKSVTIHRQPTSASTEPDSTVTSERIPQIDVELVDAAVRVVANPHVVDLDDDVSRGLTMVETAQSAAKRAEIVVFSIIRLSFRLAPATIRS